MTKMCHRILAILGLTLSFASSTMAADKPGCADAAGIARYSGSSLVICETRKFQSYDLPIGVAKRDADGGLVGGFEKSQPVSGRLVQNVYAAPTGVGSEEVFRTYKADLESRGFKVLFVAEGPNTTKIGDFFENQGPGTQLWDDYNSDAAHYLAAVKEDGAAKIYIALFMNEHLSGYDKNFAPADHQVVVRLDALQVGELKDRMVTVSASKIADDIDKSGRVALYGILFGFNKATIEPQSRPALDEISKYLKDHPGQKIYIVGHTDNVGGWDFNMRLSQARAQAVLSELSASYGIAQPRMRASGIGFLAPLASNASDEGRAKNRRVELLPQ